MASLAAAIVALAGIYLVALGAVALAAPQRARRFLDRFASSAAAHFVELAIRLAVGAAFIVAAPHSRFADAFTVFGWILVLTAAGLSLVPWRWHRRFAVWAVPFATRNMVLFAIVSVAAGGLVLWAL